MQFCPIGRQTPFTLVLLATTGLLNFPALALANPVSSEANLIEQGDLPSATLLQAAPPGTETIESPALEGAIALDDTLETVEAHPSEVAEVAEAAEVVEGTEVAVPVNPVEAIAPASNPGETTVLLDTLRSLGSPQSAPVAANPSMAQLTSVSQLSDVAPTDWAYQALQSLVERYGCIVGYPDATFRGGNALSRYEFAAGLNACMDRINEIIAMSLEDVVTQQDLATLLRLQEEFAAELATLRGRVDALEARTNELEANQFSTTTRLFGQVVLGIQDRTDNTFEFFQDEFEDEYNTNVITNVQLSLVTQFSPRSILLTGLQAGNGSTSTGIRQPALNTYTGLSYEGNTDTSLELSDLTFRHLLTDDLALIVGAQGVNAVNVFRGAGRVESAGFGPISRFAQRNPIIAIGNGRGGAGFDWQISPWLSMQGVYSASAPGDAIDGGLFGGEDGSTSIGAQVVASVTPDLDLALQYVNAYSPFGNLGTGVGDDQVAVLDGNTLRSPIQTNAFGSSLEWRMTPGLSLGGWVGYTTSDLLGQSGSVETLNWMAYLNFPDLFGEGNMGGLYVGQPPRIVDSDLPAGRNVPALVNGGNLTADGGQPSTATHVEAFYRFRLSDNIHLTPGVVVIFNPGHSSDNDTIAIGALRTTFTF